MNSKPCPTIWNRSKDFGAAWRRSCRSKCRACPPRRIRPFGRWYVSCPRHKSCRRGSWWKTIRPKCLSCWIGPLVVGRNGTVCGMQSSRVSIRASSRPMCRHGKGNGARAVRNGGCHVCSVATNSAGKSAPMQKDRKNSIPNSFSRCSPC